MSSPTTTRGLLALGLAVLLLAPSARAGDTEADENHSLRVGVSARTMVDLDRTDVTAALKVWIETIAFERGVRADTRPHVFEGVEAMVEALERGQVDIISAPADEFVAIENVVPLTGYYTTASGGSPFETCVLVVRRDDPVETLSDLRDNRLMVLTHPSAGLAPVWLDTELMRLSLPVSDRFFGSVEQASDVNRAVLPVFFGQADASLVTKRGFDLVAELNPQVLKELRVLVSSPAVIPGIGSHRATLDPAIVKQFREAMFGLSDTVAGKHILTLFQSDGFVELTEDNLATTRALLAEHARLSAATPVAVVDAHAGTSGKDEEMQSP